MRIDDVQIDGLLVDEMWPDRTRLDSSHETGAMSATSGCITRGAPAELWQALVHDAGARAGVALDESRESYLVFVLLRYQSDAGLLARTQALDWFSAQANVGSARADALRDVGDRCLLIAGLYPALAARRRVAADYFIDLGTGAYLEVAQATRNAYAALFEQLARSYRELVRILGELRGVPQWRGLIHPAMRA